LRDSWSAYKVWHQFLVQRGARSCKGGDREWRIGDYRVIYTIDDRKLLVEVTHIRHRREEAYQD